MSNDAREQKIRAAAGALGTVLLNNGWANDWDDSDADDREALLIDAEAILIAADALPSIPDSRSEGTNP